jgi:hypothetical protein
MDEGFKIKINPIIGEKKYDNAIQTGYLNKLGKLNEMILISDSRFVLQVRYYDDNKLIASFTNEIHKVQVQEIIFEKYWNEVKSLEGMNRN